MTKAKKELSLCGAKGRTGNPCRRPAGWGTDHVGVGCCKLHGGSMRNQRVHAALIIEEREARTMLERLGHPDPLGNPVDELLAIAAESRSWQTILRERVSELARLTTEDILAVEREKALVLLYERALDRTSRILESLVKLNLDARRLALDELQTELVFRAFQSMLATIPEQYQETARQSLIVALRKEDSV